VQDQLDIRSAASEVRGSACYVGDERRAPNAERDLAGVPFGIRRTGPTGVVRSARSVVAVGAPSAQKSDNVTSV
jgi:hypothetical protein